MLEKIPSALGQALEGTRAGIENTVLHRLCRDRDVPQFEMTSRAFKHAGFIPKDFTADGEGMSPPLAWRSAPADTGCLILIVEDADSPTPHPLVHAIAVLPADAIFLETGALPSPNHSGIEGVDVGANSYLTHAWLPPDPPPGHGDHRYVFQLFALTGGPAPSPGLGRGEVFDMVRARLLAAACLIGVYSRSVDTRVSDLEATLAENSLAPV